MRRHDTGDLRQPSHIISGAGDAHCAGVLSVTRSGLPGIRKVEPIRGSGELCVPQEVEVGTVTREDNLYKRSS